MTSWQPPAYMEGRALVLDPSLTSTGYAVLSYQGGVIRIGKTVGSWRPYGLLLTTPEEDNIRRRYKIMRAVRALARTFQPEIFIYEAIENTLCAKLKAGESTWEWPVNALKLIGGIEAVADQRRRPIHGIQPQDWKRHWNIPMGKAAEGIDVKKFAIKVCKAEFGLFMVGEDDAEAILMGAAKLEKLGLGSSKQLRLL